MAASAAGAVYIVPWVICAEPKRITESKLKAIQPMEAQQIEDKYTGDTASQYEKRREGSAKWENEQEAVELLLNKIIPNSEIESLLDIPVGTGRFFDIYSGTKLNISGIDISDDMIKQSKRKANEYNLDVSLQHGNILEPETIGCNPDLVVCIRLLNWFTFEELAKSLENIRDLDVKYAIIGVRTQPDQSMSIKKKIWLKQAQILSQLLNWRRSYVSGINIHPKDEFLSQVRLNGFHIENRVLVALGTSFRHFESEYYIYLLKNSR